MLAVSPTRELLLGGRPRDYYAKRWGLVSYWKLDEASGTASDAYGTNHLTATNSPVGISGKVGNARQFVLASSQYVSILDNASISTGDIDFWLAAQVYLDTKPATSLPFLYKAVADGGTTRDYALDYDGGGDRLRFRAFGAGGTAIGNISANTLGSPGTATWYSMVAYHDAVNNTVGIAVNGGAFDTAATTGAPVDTTGFFAIGLDPATTRYMNGRIDNACFGKNPSGGIAGVASEINSVLWNNGAGRSIYPWAG